MLLILLMLTMLVAGLVLWFVLVLRKIAILVVVAFAPLLIAGYLWAPTRPWVRRATEVLVALVFAKTAIYALFGIGLALLARGAQQSLSDFVGAVVLLTGACFTPLLMLRLVHFAADTHLAGDMMGTLRGGMQPVVNRLPIVGTGRHEMARHAAQRPTPDQARENEAATPQPNGNRSGHVADQGTGLTGAHGAGPGAGAGTAGGAAAGAAAVGVLFAKQGVDAAYEGTQKVQGMAGDLVCEPPPGRPADLEPPRGGEPADPEPPLNDSPGSRRPADSGPLLTGPEPSHRPADTQPSVKGPPPPAPPSASPAPSEPPTHPGPDGGVS